MRPNQFARHYPSLYHMAEPDALKGILQHGLLSTSALLDIFNIRGITRRRIECCRRPDSVVIQHPTYGSATIRDQKPICDSKLRQGLVGCTPGDWYRLLNGKVFFWTTQEKLLGLLNARAYRDKKHIVLTVNSSTLLHTHFNRVSLSHINSGAMPYGPTPRGLNTFVAIAGWPDRERPRAGGLARPVVEVAIDYSVPDLSNYILRIEEWLGGKVKRII